MKKLTIINLLFLIMSSAFGQAPSNNKLYLNQSPPDTIPQVFAPGVISLADRYEYGSSFSKDGTEFYFGVDQNASAGPSKCVEIWSTYLKNGKWTKPKALLSHPRFSQNDPMLSPDESKLFFISNRPLKGNEPKDIDLWYVERTKKGWSEPKNVGAPVNSKLDEYYASFSNDGSLYFSSIVNTGADYSGSFDIYKSAWKGGAFQNPVKLPKTINTGAYEADVYVAPDESYLIFCTTRRSGYGRGDLYISFKDDAGNWTKAKNMGQKINSTGHELCPFVTQDGKYFFYTSNKEIYWVSTAIFDHLR